MHPRFAASNALLPGAVASATDIDAQIAGIKCNGSGQPHFRALDSLRGFLACIVAACHFHSDGYISQSLPVQHAGLFVDFFFVLSGFVITASYGNRLRTGFSALRFMALRLGRLYPLHFAVMLAVAMIQTVAHLLSTQIGVGPSGHYSIRSFFMTLSLVQIFSAVDAGNWNPPTWSIAAEIWAYLIFAFACRFSGRFFLAAMIAIVLIAPVFSPDYVFTIGTGALPRCLYGFAIGVLCYSAWNESQNMMRRIPAIAATAMEGVTIATALIALCLLRPEVAYFICPWLFAAVILLMAAERGGFSRLLLCRPFLLLGALSFSIYMIHEFVEARVANVLRLLHFRLDSNADDNVGHVFITRTWPFPLASDTVTLLALGTTVASAYFTFHFIEEPARTWSRRVVGRKPDKRTLTRSVDALGSSVAQALETKASVSDLNRLPTLR